MPGGDGTGPGGMGPMTGRAAGYCAGYSVPGFMNPIPGQGSWGWGRGGGWGRRNLFYATGLPGWQRAAVGSPAFGAAGAGYAPYATPFAAVGSPALGVPGAGSAPYATPFAPAMTHQQELDMLKGQAEYFEDALDGIKKRIEELAAKAEK